MDAETRKEINSLRFNWHKRLIGDAQLRKHPTSIVFASLVLHRFVAEKGYAEISLETARRELNMTKASVIRARDYLIPDVDRDLSRRSHINTNAEQIPQSLLKSGKREQRNAFVYIDEQVHVASVAICTMRHRSEDAHIPRPVRAGNFEHLIAVLP